MGTNSSGKINHPAVFPVELPIRCLKFADYKKDWMVLDPFCETGSTLIACCQLGIKNTIGIDIDESYINFTKKRISCYFFSILLIRKTRKIWLRKPIVVEDTIGGSLGRKIF